ncbi:Hypothetical predicted protein [Olea europaea subsp. europaea]|uniref:Uncharacterized protein n=1 Tax=Olea europaea subsp. europaea TaxID=158383 RepID=A0A8S0SL56_OLEEU|nr:Hypothetical predicted protein [Olea europaea subsp. europaea]
MWNKEGRRGRAMYGESSPLSYSGSICHYNSASAAPSLQRFSLLLLGLQRRLSSLPLQPAERDSTCATGCNATAVSSSSTRRRPCRLREHIHRDGTVRSLTATQPEDIARLIVASQLWFGSPITIRAVEGLEKIGKVVKP